MDMEKNNMIKVGSSVRMTNGYSGKVEFVYDDFSAAAMDYILMGCKSPTPSVKVSPVPEEDPLWEIFLDNCLKGKRELPDADEKKIANWLKKRSPVVTKEEMGELWYKVSVITQTASSMNAVVIMPRSRLNVV